MDKTRKVVFEFDERSRFPLPDIYPPGTLFDTIKVTNPTTGENREFLIPKLERRTCPECGQVIDS